MDLYPYDYEITSVPAGCTSYEKGQIVTLYEPDPPPQTVTLHPSGACDGTVATLIPD